MVHHSINGCCKRLLFETYIESRQCLYRLHRHNMPCNIEMWYNIYQVLTIIGTILTLANQLERGERYGIVMLLFVFPMLYFICLRGNDKGS